MHTRDSLLKKILTRATSLTWVVALVVLVFLVVAGLYLARVAHHALTHYVQEHATQTSTIAITAPIVSTTTLPVFKELEDGYFISQTFNNCGPSALSMDLSYYGVHVSQEALADDLRPTHNEQGKNDDKSTTPDELVAEAGKYGFAAYYRPDGSIQLLKEFIANDIPVMTRTLFIPTEDFGHYRVIKGYNDGIRGGQIADEDGFQGSEVHYTYSQFMSLWQEYNYEYIVVVPPGKEALVESIIGKDINTSTAWQNAKAVAESEGDTFNESVADYYLGNYADSVSEFEKAEPTLSPHALWYQLEPLESYLALGQYAKVFSLAQSILTNGDTVYPGLYVLEAEAYEKEGDTMQAKEALQTALTQNPNLPTISAEAKLVAASL